MNRLATRLLLAFLLVALLSLIAVPVAQGVAARHTFGSLNPEFRGRVERSLGRPARSSPERLPFRTDTERRSSSDGQSSDDSFLRDENTRLLRLLSSYRAAQRQAVAFGVGSAVLLSVLLAWLLSRTIARPIEAVSDAASQLAGGNLAARVDLERLPYPATETRALALDFNQMASALGRLEGERKAMIADIAHELRNPLATLQLRLDALSDGLVSFNDSEARLLQGQVGLLGRLIGDLRTLSLADAGRLTLHRLELDLSDLADKVTQQVRLKAEAADVRLEFLPASEPAVIDADPDRLTQVLHNLLDNAFRVTPAGGKVAVQLCAAGAEVTLCVRDTGPGIAEADLETVFERFVKGRRRDTETGPDNKTGSGLGLAIVQSLVKSHGGRVRASNYSNKDSSGAQLEVILPRLNHTAESHVIKNRTVKNRHS